MSSKPRCSNATPASSSSSSSSLQREGLKTLLQISLATKNRGSSFPWSKAALLLADAAREFAANVDTVYLETLELHGTLHNRDDLQGQEDHQGRGKRRRKRRTCEDILSCPSAMMNPVASTPLPRSSSLDLPPAADADAAGPKKKVADVLRIRWPSSRLLALEESRTSAVVGGAMRALFLDGGEGDFEGGYLEEVRAAEEGRRREEREEERREFGESPAEDEQQQGESLQQVQGEGEESQREEEEGFHQEEEDHQVAQEEGMGEGGDGGASSTPQQPGPACKRRRIPHGNSGPSYKIRRLLQRRRNVPRIPVLVESGATFAVAAPPPPPTATDENNNREFGRHFLAEAEVEEGAAATAEPLAIVVNIHPSILVRAAADSSDEEEEMEEPRGAPPASVTTSPASSNIRHPRTALQSPRPRQSQPQSGPAAVIQTPPRRHAVSDALEGLGLDDGGGFDLRPRAERILRWLRQSEQVDFAASVMAEGIKDKREVARIFLAALFLLNGDAKNVVCVGKERDTFYLGRG